MKCTITEFYCEVTGAVTSTLDHAKKSLDRWGVIYDKAAGPRANAVDYAELAHAKEVYAKEQESRPTPRHRQRSSNTDLILAIDELNKTIRLASDEHTKAVRDLIIAWTK